MLPFLCSENSFQVVLSVIQIYIIYNQMTHLINILKCQIRSLILKVDSAKLRAMRAKNCSRANVPCVLMWSPANVLCVLTSHVPMCLACLRGHMPTR